MKCRDTEFSDSFVKKMRVRMETSYFKYGPVADNVKTVDVIESAKKRIGKYLQDGNTEWLVDAANFLMIEFMYPKHSKAHFRSTGSHESPGVVGITVKEMEKLNEDNGL
jgi:hypothetical protein